MINTTLKMILFVVWIPGMAVILLWGVYKAYKAIKKESEPESFDASMKRYAATRALTRYPDETPEQYLARYNKTLLEKQNG